MNIEGRVRLLAEWLEVGEDGVLRARPERPLEQTLEAGQTMRVVGQAEVTGSYKRRRYYLARDFLPPYSHTSLIYLCLASQIALLGFLL